MFGLRNGSASMGDGNRRNTLFGRSLQSALMPIAAGLASNLYKRRFATVPKEDLDLPVPLVYRPKSLAAVCEMTKFSKREVQIIYRSFKQGCPNGIVSLKYFQEILSQFFPRGNPKRYAEYVFKTFDRDGDHQINFEEFVTGLSVITRGTMDEKIEWIFCLYDVNDRGIIGHAELLLVTQSIYELLGRNVVPPITRKAILEHVFDVHKKMCKNGETYITREAFIKMCKEDDQLCSSLVLFDTLL
uniref:EF-hand domain-containing protein n=1 Tax=Panagrolaimus sp. ES5 TaxID=591445 RepID=A0AC34FWD3_9BILA